MFKMYIQNKNLNNLTFVCCILYKTDFCLISELIILYLCTSILFESHENGNGNNNKLVDLTRSKYTTYGCALKFYTKLDAVIGRVRAVT